MKAVSRAVNWVRWLEEDHCCILWVPGQLIDDGHVK